MIDSDAMVRLARYLAFIVMAGKHTISLQQVRGHDWPAPT